MDAYDIAQREAGEDTKICPDCLEEWELCTCGEELCILCGEEESECTCYEDR